MYIETERMIIRNFAPEDAADLYEILGDDETMRYCEPSYSFEKTRDFLQAFCIDRGGALAAAHKESGRLIGYILFNGQGEGIYETGWFFNRSFWRQGYAFESCKAVIDYAFCNLDANKIFAETVDTVRSTRLMEKLGMKPESTRDRVRDINGDLTDLYVYCLQKEDYTK